MSKYRIYFNTGASASVSVEADSLDEAIEAAYEHLPSDVCAQCSGWGQRWNLELGDGWEVDETAYDVDGEYVEVTR